MRFAAALFALIALAQPAWAQRIAFTFDDAPRAGSAIMTGPERAEALLRQLADAGISQAGFFAVADRIDEEGRERLAAYAAAGHAIANHSNTHPNLHRMEADAFIADIRAADATLRDLDGFAPLFRFPYLNEGDTVEKRDAVRAELTALGYANGYVTVDNYDWYLDRLAINAVEGGAEVDWDALGALYVDVLVGAVEHYDAIAREALGRSPAHVLLLHENDLAALYVADLAAALRERGWEIIDFGEAYADPIADVEPDTLFLGQGRVAALAEVAGSRRRDLVSAAEDEDVLAAMFEDVVATAQ